MKYPSSRPGSNYLRVLVFFILSVGPLLSQNDRFLDSLLRCDLPAFTAVLNAPDKYKLQILYTRIDRNENNAPRFTDYTFHLHKEYSYPASTVKLPVALLALMKIEELKKPGLSRKSIMITDSAFYCQKKVRIDSSSATGYPSLENYIKKMFLVSDNYSFARVFEFVGYDYAHAKLKALGFKDVRLFNRLDAQCPGDTSKITPPVYFLDENCDTIYKQPLTTFTTSLSHPIPSSKAGSSYIGANGRVVRAPKDFSNHNYLEVKDVHALMKQLVFNDYTPIKKRLRINDDNRLFMLKELGMYPRESEHPLYDKAVYYDSFKKYLFYGSVAPVIEQDSLRIINIVGRAYGFLVDCAYVVDFKNHLEFFLSCAIYVNETDRIGTGRYGYDALGLPFMKDLGMCIYNYERERERKVTPDLSRLAHLFGKPKP